MSNVAFDSALFLFPSRTEVSQTDNNIMFANYSASEACHGCRQARMFEEALGLNNYRNSKHGNLRIYEKGIRDISTTQLFLPPSSAV